MSHEIRNAKTVKVDVLPVDTEIQPLNVEKLNQNEDRIINKVFNVYHVRALVCGSSGSGKTTFIMNYLFQNLDTYGLVLYCAPTETLESGLIRSIIGPHGSENIKHIFNTNIDLDKYFFPLDIRKDKLPSIIELQSIQKKCPKNIKGQPKRIALILDDFINVLTSKDEIQQINAYLTQSSRASCDIFLLVQTYNHITPSIATNVNVLILFLKYMSKDSYNACLRRSFTGEISKEFQELIFNELKHADNHQPFIFINDQPTDKSIRYMNKYLVES
jgi:septin family protein